VMRGEETQLVGLGLGRDLTVVLPGTHAKWVRIEAGRIQRFQTYVTGEVYGLLAKHSFVAKAAEKPAAPDWSAFARGLAVALDPGFRSAGLLARLFTVRTGWLAGRVEPREMHDMLSGIVVGTEFRDARDAGWFAAGDPLAIVGDDDMAEVYRRAAEAFGARPEIAPPDTAVTGALALAALADARA
jgi:2-dehydro-3-deoxygalactonokinase